MPFEALKLGLDEALLSVDRSQVSSDSLQVYYQLEECYGCPLDKIKTINESYESFAISTKYDIQRIEIRSSKGTCGFDNLSLVNQAHYRVDVTESIAAESNKTSLQCNWLTLERGDCSLCPVAVLSCVLLVLILLERTLVKGWLGRGANAQNIDSNRRIAEQKLANGHSSSPHNGPNKSASKDSTLVENSQEVDDGKAKTSTDGDGQVEQKGSDSQGGCNRKESQQQMLIANVEPISERDQSVVRVKALDLFRGLTIAAMILVNYGGAGYRLLEHKPWNGITPADFVFPFFIFSMGASIALSVESLVEKHRKSFREIIMKIIRRSIVLAALGVCLNSKRDGFMASDGGFAKLRLTGVLQRFSFSYLSVATIYTVELLLINSIKSSRSSRVLAIVARVFSVTLELMTAITMAAVYVYVTFFMEYDASCPIGYIEPGGQTTGGQYANCTGGAAGWLDRTLLGENHMYNDTEFKKMFKTTHTHDPEGILGTSSTKN